MERLRERQRMRAADALAARRRIDESRGHLHMMTAAAGIKSYQDTITARWTEGPTVVAFLFAHPDSEAVRLLDARGDYFDCRSGDTWDLFFPGYYRSSADREFERRVGGVPVGRDYADDWYFDAKGFDTLRAHIEGLCEHRWEFSGGTDLVLINAWLVADGEPTIDWASTLSGQLTEADSTPTLTLAQVVEKLTRDLVRDLEDPNYGVSAVVAPSELSPPSIAREVVASALGGIAAALGVRGLGV
jgi:hypothetical protein